MTVTEYKRDSWLEVGLEAVRSADVIRFRCEDEVIEDTVRHVRKLDADTCLIVMRSLAPQQRFFVVPASMLVELKLRGCDWFSLC